jgi:hypothetical protein
MVIIVVLYRRVSIDRVCKALTRLSIDVLLKIITIITIISMRSSLGWYSPAGQSDQSQEVFLVGVSGRPVTKRPSRVVNPAVKRPSERFVVPEFERRRRRHHRQDVEDGVDGFANPTVAVGGVEEDYGPARDEVTPTIDRRRGRVEHADDEAREHPVDRPDDRRTGRVTPDDDVVASSACPVEHPRREVDPDDPPLGTDRLSKVWPVRAGATTHLDDGVPRSK